MKKEFFITTLLMCFTFLVWTFYVLFKIPIWIPISFNILQVFWLIIILKNNLRK